MGPDTRCIAGRESARAGTLALDGPRLKGAVFELFFSPQIWFSGGRMASLLVALPFMKYFD